MENNKRIQEMQILEHNLQNFLLQKQAFEMELLEAESALKEIDKSGEEVYKIIGQLMIKTEKDKIKEELENKRKIIGLRIKSLEKQEKSITEKLEKLREELMKDIKK
jgi:prefoldin beta subunit